MRRREFIAFIAGAAASMAPSVSRSQPAMPVIGFLLPGSAEMNAGRLSAFSQGLNEAGFVEGRNVAIESRPAFDGQIQAVVAELVRRQVNVIFANPTAAALAAKRATSTIPIVFVIGGDPVEFGLVASVNRPGGNVTGVTFLVNKLAAKRMQLLSELVPGTAPLGMLVDMTNPNAEAETSDTLAATKALGRKLCLVKAGAEDELEAAFADLAQQKVAGLFIASSARFLAWNDKLVELSARYAMPASFAARRFADTGGLMTYGTDIFEAFRQAGVYTGRILKGAKPAELPVAQSTKFEFVLNLKTAKTLGLTIAPGLLSIADEVIE